jgi:hypothetical protein
MYLPVNCDSIDLAAVSLRSASRDSQRGGQSILNGGRTSRRVNSRLGREGGVLPILHGTHAAGEQWLKLLGRLNQPAPLRTERRRFDGNFTAANTSTLDGFGADGVGVHSHAERLFISSIVPRATVLLRRMETLR